MKVLSIETSTMLGGVAVVDENAGLIAETRLNVKSTHSERLMSVIDSVLKESMMSLNDIDAFAVSIGPGSFTGLRIGLSTAKGLSYATGKPLITVPTLDAFAWNFPFSSCPVCIMLDARRNEVYTAVYRWQKNGFDRMMEELSVKPLDILEKLKGPVIFAGEGVHIYLELIKEVMKENAIIAPPDKMVPSPSNVAMLGMAKALQHDYTDASRVVPFYIRRSEAEVKLSEKS